MSPEVTPTMQLCRLRRVKTGPQTSDGGPVWSELAPLGRGRTIQRMLEASFLRIGRLSSAGWKPGSVPAPVAAALVFALVVSAVGRGQRTDLGARETPQRIITIAPNSAEIICALGACDAIVGVSKFCVYPLKLKDRPQVGGLFDPDLEKIVALRPDLVVLRGRNEPVEQLCRDRGIAIYKDKTERLADIETCVAQLGARVHRTEEAEAVVRQFHARIDAIRKRTADRPRPRVLLTISRQPDRLANLLTAGKGSFLDEMLDIAGGENVFGDLDMAYPQVSIEAIITHRAEVIIELMPEIELTPVLKAQMLEQWHRFGTIPAVTNGRVYFIVDDNCLIPSLRYVEIINKVSRMLHPEPKVDR